MMWVKILCNHTTGMTHIAVGSGDGNRAQCVEIPTEQDEMLVFHRNMTLDLKDAPCTHVLPAKPYADLNGGQD